MAKSRATGGGGGRSRFPNEPELVMVAKPEAQIRVAPSGMKSMGGAKLGGLEAILKGPGVSIAPLFGASEDRLRDEATKMADRGGAESPDLSVYYRVNAPPEKLADLAKQLLTVETVEAAYVKPGAEPPVMDDSAAPNGEEPPVTPDFNSRQGYLDAATGGIDARWAHTVAGGRGAGVRIIDVEGAWRFDHEDLLQNQGGVVGGVPSPDIGWRNHGTAVLGEFSGDNNSRGVLGICPDANVRAISIFGGMGSAGAIRAAANMLGAGDIILIELHRPGPRFNFAARNDQRGYIAVEWWPDDFDAIRFAIGRGVIVVEAGGNGAENLNDAVYNARPAGFPATWSNPFNRGGRDSGAVIVGAGAPPPGTHGRNYGPDRSRLDFSNWGTCVDAQGWGREVTTCGYGDLQGSADEKVWYTDVFSGTSSASPIVVGALGAAQGILRARGATLLTPATARAKLRSTGSPQQDAPGRPATQRIGNRPNLRAMVGLVKVNIKAEIKEIKEHIKSEIKEVKEKELKEHVKEKEIKELIKEGKEVKEGKEIKEIKEKELKEGKEKEFKETKGEVEGKLSDKIQERINVRDVIRPGSAPSDLSSVLGAMSQRLDALEARLASGEPFIDGGQRPMVGGNLSDQGMGG